jgi:hypothetical protein
MRGCMSVADLAGLAPFALCFGAIVGCSSTSATSWNLCNALPQPTVVVTQQVGQGDAPSPTGGEIALGTYELTSQTIYGASSLTSDQPAETYVFAATTFMGASLDYAASAGTWSVSQTTITLDEACFCKQAAGCTQPGAESFGYTATPTQLTYLESYVNGGTMVQTFTKE